MLGQIKINFRKKGKCTGMEIQGIYSVYMEGDLDMKRRYEMML